MISRPRVRRAVSVLAFASPLALAAFPAEAHLMTTGLGPIYDGISHFVLSPEDLIPVLVLALLGGQCGPEAGRRVLFALPAAWLLGGLIGLMVPLPAVPDLSWALFILFGGIVAANVRLPNAVIAVMAVALGLFHGFLNGATMSSSSEAIRVLAGVAATIFVLSALVGSASIVSRSQPLLMGIRVLGSWTAATGILLLGWSFR